MVNMNPMVFAVAGAVLAIAAHLPVRIADGQIYGRYFSYRWLQFERQTRLIRVVLVVALGSYVYVAFGLLSLEFAAYCVGVVMIASMFVFLIEARSKRSDAATGASLEDLTRRD